MRGLLRSPAFLLNVVAPVITYRVLAAHGMSSVDALAIAAVFPAAGALYALRRERRLDPFAALVLAVIGIGLVTDLVFHNGRILLVLESLITGVLGLVCLGSLLSAHRPAILGLRRRTTAIWGVALLTEAAARVGLSYVLPTTTFVTVSPLLALAVFGPLGLATLRPRPTPNRESELHDDHEPTPLPTRRRPADTGPALPGTAGERIAREGAHEHR